MIYKERLFTMDSPIKVEASLKNKLEYRKRIVKKYYKLSNQV